MVPKGRLHMRPFQFHLKEHWKYPRSLDSLLPWTETSVHLDWWQNPTNVMIGADLHPKDHSIQGGTHSAEMCALLWKIMIWCRHYHITLKARHIPGCLNVMTDLLSRSTEWSLHPVFKQICLKWFTPHVDLFATLNHKLPLYVSPIPDPNAWDIDALNINWMGLTAYAYRPTALLHRVIQKIMQCHCLIIVIAPGWPGIPWFWDLVQLSTEIPIQLSVSTTLLKQSHNYVILQQYPKHLNFNAWCLGVDSSKNKASMWRWQAELLHLRGHQQGPSTSQSGRYLRNGAEKTWWISPLPL